ncbi:MAG: carboxypeptidase regulatory-like domain-containing protein [Lentimicrobiaceae bacterium]|nr:carboxypeptidase regulatory-like domain-containing protein [Lentimicrobiaceae bacterium]
MKKLFTLFLLAFLFLQTGFAQLNPLDENWNAGAPAGWTYSNFSRQTSGGVDNTPCIRAGLVALTGTSGNAVTPDVFLGDNPIMTFELKATTNTAGTTAAAANTFNYRVEVRPVGSSTWTNIWDVPQNAHSPVSANFETKTVNVSAYANQTCQFRFAFNRNSGTTYVFIDDVWIGTKPDYQDLTAVSVTGNKIPAVNTSENYTVKVKNSSYTNTEAADYTVKLKKVADPVDIEIGSLPGVFIEPSETEDFVFTWTPTTAGVENIYGEVILETDPDFNPADNQTAPLQVVVLGEDPVISVTPQSVNFGTVFNNQPSTNVVVQTITNAGAAPLNVTGYTSTDPRITITGLPATVLAGTPLNIQITLDAIGLPKGEFTAQLTINSNCSENPALTINVTANIDSKVFFLYEDWDAGSNTWTYTRFSRVTSGGVNGSPFVRANIYSSGATATATIITPAVEVGSDPTLSFAFKATNYNDGTAAAANALNYNVAVSTNNGSSWTTLLTVGTGQHSPVTEDWMTKTANISSYVNQTCMVRFTFNCVISSSDLNVSVDNVMVGTKPIFDDLMAVSIEGNKLPELNTTENYTVKVRNLSFTNTMTATDYTVKFMKVADPVDIELGSLPGVEIAPFETKDFVFAWTPTSVGFEQIYGEIILPTDQNQADNKTEIMQVFVKNEAFLPVSIGDGTQNQRLPFDFLFRKSISQSIYFPEEIGTNGGLIAAVSYYTNITSNVNAPIKIWMGEVDVENLNDFVPYTNFTEVFSGNIFLPPGQYEAPVVFNVPYQYNGGTLIIYAQRFDTQTYTSTEYFRCTSTPGNVRSIRRYKDEATGVDYDWQDPTAGAGSLATFEGFPNITLSFDMDGMGILTGVVDSDEDGLLEGAKVQIVGSELYTLTDENGVYSFYLTPGNYSMEYSFLGHFSDTLPITVTADNTTTQNVTLIKFPMVSISGTVTNYSSIPLEGVEITFGGLDTYGPVYTDETGFYSIQSIFSNETYNITAHKATYQIYTNQVVVELTDKTFDFQMYDMPYKPVNIVTDDIIDDPNVVISFEMRNPDLYKLYILDDGSAESGHSSIGLLPEMRGNKFSVNEDGVIVSVDIYGMPNPSADPEKTVNILIYNAAVTLVATIDPFYISADGWFNVPINNIPYSDEFYVMVYWPPYDLKQTNFIGCDANGPNVGSVGYDLLYMNVLDFTPMIRVNAITTGGKSATYGTGNETRAAENYKIYRLPVGEETNEAAWETLSENVSGLTYTDNTFSSVSTGEYRWAVKAEYTGGFLSEATISNPPIHSADLKANVTVLVSDEEKNPVVGAAITLKNQNTAPLFSYTVKTNSDGIYLFPKILKGTYDISVTKVGYLNYADTNIEIDEDFTLDIELIDIIKTPFELSVEVDRCDALFTWNTFYTTSYILDDGGPEDAFSLLPGSDPYIWCGNEFPVEEMGFITSVEVGGIGDGTANRTVTIDIFNKDREMVGSSAPFYLPENGWITVPLDNVPYSGTFYALVRWPSVTGSQETNYLPSDLDGPNATFNLDWVREYDGTWTLYHHIWTDFGGSRAFLIRANVTVTGEAEGGKSATYGYDSEVSNSRMLEGYTIYINDMDIVTNYPNKEFMFSGLPNGTYTAGVQAVFSSGSSPIYYSDPFEITCEHTVTFIVKDVNNVLINDAVIVFGGETLSGYTALKPNGTYPYTVSKAGYANATGTVTIFDEDEEVEVTLMSTYTVTYQTPVNGSLLVTADGVTINSGDEVVAGTVLIITAIPDEGYNIGTLTVNGVAHTSGQPYTVTQDITIAATFNIQMFAVTYTATGQGTLSVTKTATGAVIANNEQVEWNTGITVSAAPEFGHYVSVFTINGTTVLPNLEVQHTVIAATAINCIFTEEGKFNLTLEVNPANSGTPTGAGDYYEDEQVPVDVEVADNYEFVEWLDGAVQVSQTASFTYTMPAATKVLTAKMQGIVINISATVEPAGGGEVTGASSDQIVYRYGDIAELTAIPNEADGYEFVYWKEGETIIEDAPATYSFTVETPRSLTAVFEQKQYKVTYETPTNGTLTVTAPNIGNIPSGTDVEHGTILTITAIPNANYELVLLKVNGEDFESGSTFTVLSETVIECGFLVGIKENILSNVVLYPNPFTNEINISNGELIKSVQITNVVGQKVSEVIFNGKSINTANLGSGIYFITLESFTGEKLVHKMIKK